MGVRYQRRMNFGSGLGLNLSKSGASPSYRTKAGGIGAKGFSIRTGLCGLSYRPSWGKGSSGIAFDLCMLHSIAAINSAFVLAIVEFTIVVALVEESSISCGFSRQRLPTESAGSLAASPALSVGGAAHKHSSVNPHFPILAWQAPGRTRHMRQQDN